jgi:CubicO group peptidase (beta-lactamase class C family)
MSFRVASALLFAVLVLSTPAVSRPAADAAPPLPLATPESQGMSSSRLERLHGEIQRFIDQGKYAGAVSLIARNGKIVDWRAYGKRDLEASLPMEKDTLVRIYSMSKIVTSVAALALLEEARFKLDDPIGDYLPSLANRKVLTGGTAESPLLADARNSITIKHLFTHTSGLTYGTGEGPIDKLYAQAKLWDAPSLGDFVERVSHLPLVHEPGEQFTYSISTDVLGALVEKVSGRSLPDFLEERLLGPLAMNETGFSVPEAKEARVAKIYQTGEDGELELAEPFPLAPTLASGGGGLFSTAADYARFMQMLLNGGELDGVRILSRKTVELMMANHLNHMTRTTRDSKESEGFGLGGAVRIDLAKGGSLGSVGQFGWAGAATTYARLDPTERMVLILLVQHFPMDQHELIWRFSNLAYAAISD